MLGRRRRFWVAAVSLVLAWAVLHPFLAGILCRRGDEFLRTGRPAEALRYYARAVAANAFYEPAVDRLALASLQVRTAVGLRSALNASEAYLERHNHATSIEIDRALLLAAIGDRRRSGRAFAELWHRLGDARFRRLAEDMTRRSAAAPHS